MIGNNTTRWILAILGDSLIFYCAYQGMLHKVEWSLNIFLFMAWVHAITTIIYGAIAKQLQDEGKLKARSPLFKTWDITTNAALALIAAADGRFILAAVLTVAAGAKENAQDRVEKSVSNT